MCPGIPVWGIIGAVTVETADKKSAEILITLDGKSVKEEKK